MTIAIFVVFWVLVCMLPAISLHCTAYWSILFPHNLSPIIGNIIAPHSVLECILPPNLSPVNCNIVALHSVVEYIVNRNIIALRCVYNRVYSMLSYALCSDCKRCASCRDSSRCWMLNYDCCWLNRCYSYIVHLVRPGCNRQKCTRFFHSVRLKQTGTLLSLARVILCVFVALLKLKILLYLVYTSSVNFFPVFSLMIYIFYLYDLFLS